MSNIDLLIEVANGLGPLCPSVIFVGGSVTELYATDSSATEIRFTDDVDCVLKLLSYSEFTKFEEELRLLKFKNDFDSNVICRWIFNGIKVDIMPDNAEVLGFTNPWYRDGILNSISYLLPDNLQIRIFSPAYFIASKMVAFTNRGNNQFRTSADFEDIIYVLDNRPQFQAEIKLSDNKVKLFLQSTFKHYLLSPAINEGIYCSLPHGSGDERVEYIKSIMASITKL